MSEDELTEEDKRFIVKEDKKLIVIAMEYSSCTVALPRGCNRATLTKLVAMWRDKAFFFSSSIVSRNCRFMNF